DWTALNRQTRSYLGSSFLHDQNRSSRYLLIEYWSEMIVYEQHRASRSAMIDSIETRRAELLDAMEPLGIYAALGGPGRGGPTWAGGWGDGPPSRRHQQPSRIPRMSASHAGEFRTSGVVSALHLRCTTVVKNTRGTCRPQ